MSKLLLLILMGMNEGVERVRECELAGGTGAGLVQKKDVLNPILFKCYPAPPTWPINQIRDQNIQVIKYVPVSCIIYLSFIFTLFQIKGTEINALLSTVPDLISSLDEENRLDVESKAEALKNAWSTFKRTLDRRTDLATSYVKFHSIVVDLANELDSLTDRLNSQPGESERRELEERNFNVTQLFTQMDNVGDNFMQDSQQVT